VLASLKPLITGTVAYFASSTTCSCANTRAMMPVHTAKAPARCHRCFPFAQTNFVGPSMMALPPDAAFRPQRDRARMLSRNHRQHFTLRLVCFRLTAIPVSNAALNRAAVVFLRSTNPPDQQSVA
jgi:hypothetical protein